MKFSIRSIRGSHVIAVVALIAACGGTSYAAATIGSAQIIDGSIQSIDVKNGTLTGSDVQGGSLQPSDMSYNVTNEFKNRWRINGTAKAVAGGAHGVEQVLCDYEHGEYAAGGGGYSYYSGKGYLTGSSPVYGSGDYTNMPIGWEVKMQNLQGSTNYLIIRVTCVKG